LRPPPNTQAACHDRSRQPAASARALIWLPCTLLLYAGSSALHRRLNKAPIANPTLLTIAALVLILACSGVPYKTYFDGVTILHYLLGTAVVALALPLYRNAGRLRGRFVGMGLGTALAEQQLPLRPEPALAQRKTLRRPRAS
jgi:putative effector of murein hydrolase